MRYFVTIVYNITSGNAINLLGTAIASDSLLVSKQVLRCQRDDRLATSLTYFITSLMGEKFAGNDILWLVVL